MFLHPTKFVFTLHPFIKSKNSAPKVTAFGTEILGLRVLRSVCEIGK